MVYILYGTEKSLIENALKEEISKLKTDNIVKLNYEDLELSDVVEEASYMDLFGDMKIIVVSNSTFLTNAKNDTKVLENYLEHPNERSIIIFTLNEGKISDKSKIYKIISENGKILEFNKMNYYGLFDYTKNIFMKDEYKISDDTIKKLLNRLNNELEILDNEIIKLKLLKYNEKEILNEDIELCVPRNIENDIFNLVSSVVKRDIEGMFKIFKELTKVGTEQIQIVSMLSNKFRLLYQVKVLHDDGYMKDKISSILKSHPYPIELALNEVSKYNDESILNIIEKLYELDKEMKTSNMDKTKIMESFFLDI